MRAAPLRRLVGAIGLLVAVTTAVSVPAGYLLVGYTNLSTQLEFRAELAAARVSKYVFLHRTMWQFHAVRLVELIEFSEADSEVFNQRIIDSGGHVVAEQGAAVSAPSIVRKFPVVVAGQPVGRVETTGSTAPLLRETGLIAALSALLGFGMYFALKVFPLRVLDRTLGTLVTTNHRFELALTNMVQGLCMFDSEQRLIVWNQRFLTLFGLTRDEVVLGMSLAEIFDIVSRRGNPFIQASGVIRAEMNRMLASGQPVIVLRELTDGRFLSIMHEPIPGGGWLSTFEDVTERRLAEDKVAHMARHDALTNLPNRLLFREQLEHTLARLHRGEQAAVLSIDLDRFKHVNDTLGHPVGDELLIAVAQRLRECTREGDTIARLGGDEFVIVQVATDLQPAETIALASRIVDVIGEPFEIGGSLIVVGASVGIAMAPADGADPDQLLKNADLALYRAKSDGRGTYRFFEAEMDARAQARRLLELDLRAAIAQGEFELHYQPILDLSTDTIVSVEALVRWNHPRRGLVAPLEFIPLAEETGLIVPLGEWILRQACSEAAKWPHGISVAVNLSPAQFKSRSLILTVVNAVAAAGLPPGRLELEITESVLLQNGEETLATLHSLRKFGVRISMDDFGTGYSSLSYLRSFPFDKIKIDRSFITDLATHNDSMAIVRAVTGLGKSLGITTTAEGVETSEQLALLRTEGCTEVQGFLLSQPVSAAAIGHMLTQDSVQRAVA
jgi:diguanylate cyclase (GGDEF)-like protein